MTKVIPIGVVLAMPISPTFAAEQYWIVQQSISSCTIVNEKPKSDRALSTNHLYRTEDHMPDIMVVSLGAGSNPIRIDAAAAMHWGDLSWAVPIISISQDGNSQTVAFETDELLVGDHWRFDASLTTKTPEGGTVNASIDDASPENIEALVNKAKQLIADQNDRINEVAKVLAQPKAKVQPQNRMSPKGMMISRGSHAGA